jgi:hypothetical protein
MDETTMLHEDTYRVMCNLLDQLKAREGSRENALAITNLEQAMMWYNKDRANKKEIEANSTHV